MIQLKYCLPVRLDLFIHVLTLTVLHIHTCSDTVDICSLYSGKGGMAKGAAFHVHRCNKMVEDAKMAMWDGNGCLCLTVHLRKAQLPLYHTGCAEVAMLKKAYPHHLPLLLQDLKSCQLLHVVLACAIIQYLLGAVNQSAQTIALAEWPPLHVTGSADPLQSCHTQAKACRCYLQVMPVSQLSQPISLISQTSSNVTASPAV